MTSCFVKELSTSLGEAIWAFSRIERETFTYLQALSSEPLDKFMERVALSGRLSVMEHLIERIQGSDDAKVLALRSIKKTLALASTRNLIAHNPWALSVDVERRQFDYNIEKITNQSMKV